MVVTLLGMTVLLHPCTKVFEAVSITALQLSLESYFVFPSSTTIVSMLTQELKAG